MRKILITGGDGFIARSLSEECCADSSVISANRETLDLTDPGKVSDYLKQNVFDIISHAAAYDAAPFFSKKYPNKVQATQNERVLF
ncbi:MAG: sugar nucleotide-binding protein [Thermodesulfobacteriota bacterium]|nr:sugar nucleotide-binding protein [Thermodesulfobacteriota bacterium]